jgi:dihydrolipoamide dehydrogenase
MVVGDIPEGIEVLVVGGGPGGYVAAIRAAQLGKDVTLVERAERLGGICLNHGCIPSKALIHAADLYHSLKSGGEMGIITGNLSVDFKKLMNWKDMTVSRLTDGVAKLCKGNGVKVIHGELSFTSDRSARITGSDGGGNIEFENAIVATGSSPIQLPGMETDEKDILTSSGILALRERPQRLLVVGGGYIGLELGTFYAKLGTEVVVVEMLDGLLPGVDKDLVRMVARQLKKLDVKTYLSSTVKEVKKGSEGLKVIVAAGNEEVIVPVDKVLMSVGRRPNTAGFGLEKIGVKLDEKGFISVDDQCRTNIKNLYAIGDVAGEPMLAHKASREGIVAAEVIGGLKSARDWQAIPAVIFSDPEIATVGLSEEEAVAEGHEVTQGRFPFAASGRALTMNKDEGFIKVVAEKSTGRILGVRIVGPEASTIISEGALAVEMAATLDDIAITIHPHPTLPESMMEAAEAAMKKAIHILNR